MKLSVVALGAALATGWTCLAHAGVVYQNTTNATGSAFVFNGATLIGSDTAANVDVNEVTLAANAAGQRVTSLSFQAYNFNSGAVTARPLIGVWAADGTGGDPGTLLATLAPNPVTFAPGVNDLTVTGGPAVPADLLLWLGIGFDDNGGTTGITASQLDNLGAVTYHPATVGMDDAQAVFIAPGADFVSDPTVSPFGAPFGANYGWTVQAAAVPEPASMAVLGMGLAALSLVRRKRA